MKPYMSISCALHSELEWLAMHKVRVELRLDVGQGLPATLTGLIKDVFTREKAEFARVEARDGSVDIRLDLILGVRQI